MSEQDLRITLKDVFSLVQAQSGQISDLIGEVRIANERAVHDRKRADDAEKRSEDHEGRIRTLERRIWAIPSVASFVGVGGLVVALLPYFQK